MGKNSTKRIIKGIVLSAGDNYFDSESVEILIKTLDGFVVNITYVVKSEIQAESISLSVKKGMLVSCGLKSNFNPLEENTYFGKGAIQIHDFSEEIDFLSDEFVSGDDDEKFSEEEIALVHAVCEHAKSELKAEFDLSQASAKEIDRQLDRLAKKSESQTKRKWKRFFVSVLIAIAVELGFGATITGTLYSVFKKVVSDVLEGRILSKRD